MANLFQRKSPMQKLETQLATAKARADLLHQHLRAAQIANDAATDARQAHLIDGDLADAKAGAALQARVTVAESSLAGIEAALAVIETSINSIEQQLNAEAVAAARKSAADKITADAADIETMLAPWIVATNKLADSFAKLNLFEAGSVANFLRNASGELQLASGLVLSDAASNAVGILSGQRPIPAAATAATAYVEPAPPTTTRVFAVRDVKWKTSDGFQQISAAYFDVDLSPETARRAIRNKHAVAIDDPVRRELHGTRPGHPNPARCIDLDADNEAVDPKPDAAIRHDQIVREPFQRVDRGGPRELKLAATRGASSND